LTILLREITVDTTNGRRQGGITSGPEIRVCFEVGAEFTAQALLVIEPDQDLTTVLGTVQNALLVLQHLILICQWCEHGDQQGPVQLIANGKAITTTIEGKIHTV